MRMRTLTSKKWNSCATGSTIKLRKNLDFLPRLATAFANGFDICLIAKNPNLASGKAGATMMFINNSCTWLVANKFQTKIIRLKALDTNFIENTQHRIIQPTNYLQVKIENFKSSVSRYKITNSVCLRFNLSCQLTYKVAWYEIKTIRF